MEGFARTYNWNKHRPFHIYEGFCYFVTGRCYDDLELLKDENKKKILKTKLAQLSEEMEIGIIGWVILHDHYHLLFLLNRPQSSSRVGVEGMTNASSSSGELSDKPNDKLGFVIPPGARGEKLVKFIRRLHAITSREFNKLDQTPSRKVWYQYWDYCIRNKPDFWKHFNYIIKNPLKHGLVKSLAEAYHYKYSSNPVWLGRFGYEGMRESFVRYPVKAVNLE